MATLTVRGLDDELVRRLRIRAAEHGRSTEAEHREILRRVLEEAPCKPARAKIVERLAAVQEEIRSRTAGSSADLLATVRDGRLRQPMEGSEDR